MTPIVYVIGSDTFYPTEAQLLALRSTTANVVVDFHFFDGSHTRSIGPDEQAALKAVAEGSARFIETEAALMDFMREQHARVTA